MRVSVIIPTYNRRGVLARTLATLFAQDFPSRDYEIVVVVDGSTDGTADYLQGLKPPCALRIVELPRNQGQAAARNAGIRVSRADLVMFLDDDILCNRSLLSQHVAAHNDNSAKLIAGAVFVSPDSPCTLATDRAVRDAEWRSHVEHRVETDWRPAAGANTSLPRPLLNACGGFDEAFSSMYEDVDLYIRLWKMGVRFVYEPKAAVRTVYVKSARQLIDDAHLRGRHHVLLGRKEPLYRRHAALSALATGSLTKRAVRAACARLPMSLEPALKIPFSLAEHFRRNAMVRHFGVRLLDWRMDITTYRSALAEAGSWAALRREFGMRLPVLLYHKVSPRHARSDEFSISPERFRQQMAWLARHDYVGIRPSDWLAWVNEGKELPPKPVLITFDDGYLDTADYALPTLRQYGFGAAVYVVTGQIGGTNTWDEEKGADTEKLMTAEQIRYWAANGIEFGAHSRTHRDLTALKEPEIREEVVGSREDLERLLGRQPLSFAYPYGCYSDAVKDSVSNAFALALSCDGGINDLTTDPYVLRRRSVAPADSLIDLQFFLHLGWEPIKSLRARVRLRSRVASLFSFMGSMGSGLCNRPVQAYQARRRKTV